MDRRLAVHDQLDCLGELVAQEDRHDRRGSLVSAKAVVVAATGHAGAQQVLVLVDVYNHDTLPIGEFAIGTNTTAYVMANKYDIVYKLPILIVEKMGPHFALGDTCYSRAEDIKVYNPDGKEIISKENEISSLRKTQPEKAYFNCHTDITIPYEEIGSITAVEIDGKRTDIIRNGRFVLEGCEELNRPFEK